VAELGKMLVGIGLLMLVVGGIFMLAGRTHLPIGRLPGDILYRGKNTTFYFPVVTCIVISIVISVVIYLVGRFGR
jgi:DUF2905 family protein